MSAVSYTHLDVYKRQVLENRTATRRLPGINGEIHIRTKLCELQSALSLIHILDGDEIIDLGDETEQVLAEMKKTLESEQETELAFSIADRFISIQEVDGGYDYSIMGADYKEIDGGIYDLSLIHI